MVPFAVPSTTIGPAPGERCWRADGTATTRTRTSAASAAAAAMRSLTELLTSSNAPIRPPAGCGQDASWPPIRLRTGRRPADAIDANSRTQVGDRATAAERIDRPADVLPPRHQIEIDERPPAARDDTIQRVLGLLGRLRQNPPETIRDAVHVRVDADVL